MTMNGEKRLADSDAGHMVAYSLHYVRIFSGSLSFHDELSIEEGKRVHDVS